MRPQISGILDFGFWGFWILDFGDFGSWGFGILDFGDFGFWGFWILDCGDFGSWILDRYVANLYVRPPTPQIWGFGILDFGGFGDFGFWILGIFDFGFWILRLGGWKSLGAKLEANFGFYIRVRRLCTPPRVGGFPCKRHGSSGCLTLEPFQKEPTLDTRYRIERMSQPSWKRAMSKSSQSWDML